MQKKFHAILQTCYLVSLQTCSKKLCSLGSMGSMEVLMQVSSGKKHVEKHSSPVTTFLLYTCKANLGWRGSLQS
jgi:hypothetical protein